jgi:hypothetical protein
MVLFLYATLGLAWEIVKFKADYEILEGKACRVSEVIKVHFPDQRRGIFRQLPKLFNADNNTLYYSNISARPMFVVSIYTEYLNIRMGDPEKTVTGRNRYEVNYTMNHNFNEDIYYINVAGFDWDVPISILEFSIQAPPTVNLSHARFLSGPVNSKTNAANCTHRLIDGKIIGECKNLRPRNGITVYGPLSLDDAEVTIKTKTQSGLLGVLCAIVVFAVIVFLIFAAIGFYQQREDRNAGYRYPNPNPDVGRNATDVNDTGILRRGHHPNYPGSDERRDNTRHEERRNHDGVLPRIVEGLGYGLSRSGHHYHHHHVPVRTYAAEVPRKGNKTETQTEKVSRPVKSSTTNFRAGGGAGGGGGGAW